MAENNAVLMRRELLTRLSELFYRGELENGVDRIPLELRPRSFVNVSRCCVYKDRAMLRYKIMALLGFNIRDEQDELTPLSRYVEMARRRTGLSKEPLTVVDDVCSACVRVNYVVTNMCRGCMARPCTTSCNKWAISFDNGQARIAHERCVNCGLCMKNCPFHAIVYIPVPCEESCPVGAIGKREDGTEEIDYSKCIYCGRCISSCPFGAVMEKSHLMDVFNAFGSGRRVVAMVAPAIAGQFRAPLGQILGAVKALGFTDVVEVARGADVTSTHEAEEFIHKMSQGQKFMTTSCCPSYRVAVEKHIPQLKPYVSDTLTPMQYTAQIAREMYPDAALVFIGPCLAKRQETTLDPNADLMLSFEELQAMMEGKGVDIAACEPVVVDASIDHTSRGYPVSNGVMNAVNSHVAGRVEIRPVVISGIDKAVMRDMKNLPESCTGNMVEVMACPGGCVNGCNVIANPKVARTQVIEAARPGAGAFAAAGVAAKGGNSGNSGGARQ
ncbi:MAG: monomeric [FeFe] hydrogenase [Rikenellaceae bacterium]|jgi:[FeFe] hydrogenase (group B1/B3)|nr:monomeric [FeFe] hydrogenase [Rikenellaceae bacterium]